MSRAWNAYWFTPAPCFDLAVVRIIACFAALFYAWHNDLYTVIAGLGPMPHEIYSPFIVFKVLNAPLGWGAGADGVWAARPSPEFVSSVLTVFVVAAIMGMLGLLTNVALFVAGLAFLYVALYKYAFRDFHHADPAMIIALLAMALSPAGRVLSLDSLIRNRGNPVDPLSVRSTFAGWPLKLVRWLFVFFYLSAVFSKMTHSGLDWANGYTLQWFLTRAGSAEGHGLAMWLSHYHTLVMLGQIGVLLFQSTFVLCVIFPKLRWIYVPVGLLLHTTIYITLGAPFFTWMGLYAVFIPWSEAAKRLGGRKRPRPAAA